MNKILHITSGDIAGKNLENSGIEGEVFVWHDILYDGLRKPGWPDGETLKARSMFIEEATGKGLCRELVLKTLELQYAKLKKAAAYHGIILWFDACLFDQSMLAHVLVCLGSKKVRNVELICLNAFPGITPFNGIGQLHPSHFLSVYPERRPVTEEEFLFAETADKAFALQDKEALSLLSNCKNAPLPWIPAAAERWLQEQPDSATGLGQLEKLVLEAVCGGNQTPCGILAFVAARDTVPRFWGDNMLWAKINSLAERHPPLLEIEGPCRRLPQWESNLNLNLFRITEPAGKR